MAAQINSEKKIEYYPKNDFYSLDRVFGLGSKNNYSISVNNINGIIAWVTGPYVVFYDLSVDKQISFLKNVNNKIISCIKFSKNGKLFATGEGNCRNGAVCIYEFSYSNDTNEEIHKLIWEKKAHKSGIEKILFMKDDRFILSIGNDDDKIMNILDIKNKHHIFSSKFNRPILCTEVSDEFIILCGTGFIKKYNYEKLLIASHEELESKNLMQKSLVDLSKLQKCSFMSTVIYENSLDKNLNKIFFMTLDGYLVEMKYNESKLSRWVHLKAQYGFSLAIWKNMIGCGLSDGIYRVFNADNLNHVLTLQRPPPLGKLNLEVNSIKINSNINSQKNGKDIFPDIIATTYNYFHEKLIVIYSDKTFFIWDINQLNNVHIYRNNIFHTGGIKAMDYIVSHDENVIKLVTCSDDNTVILWNLKFDEFIVNPISNKKNQHIYYSKYIKHIFYFCKNFKHFKVDIKNILHMKNNSNNTEEEFYLTTVKFSPDGKNLAIGDSIGNLIIYNLQTFEEIISIPAHSGDINSIDMITNFDTNESFLSTGGADNFISVFDISKGFSQETKNILEKMKSPVINSIFCIDKNKNLKLVTAEQNSTITFFSLENFEFQILQQYHPENVKTYCLNYSKSIQKILSGHNGKISIWKTSKNMPQKHFQVNKGDKPLDNFRIASDSSGVMFATSNNDKIIRIRSFHNGELLCKIPVSESISSIYFILDDNYLIATSIEGYIYFYKLNQDLIQNMKKNNDLINSTEGQKIIKNKFLFLEKLMENDTSLSKNEKMQYLFDKFKRSEEINSDDMKHLNDFVKEGKKKHQDIHEENKIKNSNEIILKEEKPNNNDDQENDNNENENKEKNNNNILVNKSKIFEKELKEKNILTRTSLGRTSLTDTYMKKNVFPKIKIIDKKKDEEEEEKNIIDNIDNKLIKEKNDEINKTQNEEHSFLPIKENYDNDKSFKNENKNELSIKDKNDIMEMNEIIKNANNMINNVDLQLQNELSNKSNINKNNQNDPLINTENIIQDKTPEKDMNNNKDDENLNIEDIELEKKNENENNIHEQQSESNININEEIEKKNFEKNDEYTNSIQSSFKGKIFDDSQVSNSNISQKYQNLNLTETSSGFNYLFPNKNNFEVIIPCQEENLILEKSKEEIREISKQNDIEIIGDKMSYKSKIKKYITEIDINAFEGKDELKNIEKKLEILLNNIKIKLGDNNEKSEIENILEKYSILLLDKIENGLNKNK